MAKESGIGFQWTIDDASGSGQDLSNDIGSFSFNTPRGVQDITGLDKSAIERIMLLADGSLSMTGFFNDAANKSHAVFKTIPTQAATGTGSTRTAVGVHSGQTLTMELVLTDYSMSRNQDGSIAWTVTGSLANGTAPTWS